jgi:hypothetical protein
MVCRLWMQCFFLFACIAVCIWFSLFEVVWIFYCVADKTSFKNFTLCGIAQSRNSVLCGIARSFFGIVWSWNKIFSAFTEAVNVTVYLKIGHRWSCLPHGSKIKFLSLTLSNKKNRLCTMRQSTESIFGIDANQITPPIQIYIQNRFYPWIRRPRGTF